MEDMTMPMNMTMNMVMQMTFYNDHHFKLYFDSWEVDNDSKYYGALFALFLAGVGLELFYFLLKLVDSNQRKSKKEIQSIIIHNSIYAGLYFL